MNVIVIEIILAHPEQTKDILQDNQTQVAEYFQTTMNEIVSYWEEVKTWCEEQGITTDQLLEHLEEQLEKR